MAGWAGFSDADLMQIKQTSSPGPPRQTADAATKQAMARKQKAQQQRDMARQRALDFAQGSSAPLPSSQRLSSPSPAPPASKEEVKEQTEAEEKTAASQSSVADSAQSQAVEGDTNNKTEEKEAATGVKEMDEEEGLRVELSRVEQFRLQQKKMEEENKQRRRILADAIKERSKVAKEEAEKLTKVQRELKHLDSLVNADVSIIRDKIEAASMDFLQAQKRYERAEKEFVEAKMALAEKSDLKESLTEHLYTIIQQNETRKAERLAVMMKELGLGSDDYPVLLNVPPLLSFSPINTLHKPHTLTTPPSSTPASPESAPAEGSLSPCPEQPGPEAAEEGKSGEQGTNKEGALGIVVSEGEKSDKSNVDIGAASTETGGVDAEQGQSVGGKSEGEEKKDDDDVGEKRTEKARVENGSPESQDGGASAVL